VLRQNSSASFASECDLKVDDWRITMDHLRSVRFSVARATLLEIGTGWYPTFPTCFYLAGAARVHTYDIVRHVTPEMVSALASRLRLHLGTLATSSGLAEDTIAAELDSFRAALERGDDLGTASGGVIDYRVGDASRTGLPDGSVDMVFSNSVLEHIPQPVLEALFAEAMRVLRPGGIVFHSVNCGDHYAYFDSSISQLNYLRYSDREWNLMWNNRFHYQNRLRAKEFTAMAQRAGFTIELDASKVWPQRLAELAAIEVAPEFARYTREEACLTNIDFVARKPRATSA
jgi:SAM-dependent methyltransferase